jgi:hypothetical protein
LFSFQDARERPVDWGNLKHERLEVAQKGATEDFGLWLVENESGLVGGLTYNTDLYRPDTARQLHERFVALLLKIGREPQAKIADLLAEVHPASLLQSSARANLTSADSASDSASDSSAIHIPVSSRAVGQPQVGDRAQLTSTAPWSDAEIKMREIWSALLKVDMIEQQDNFFDLGGNSLLAMQAVALAERHFDSKVDARRYVFESLAQLVKAYGEQVSIATPNKVSLLGRLFGGRRGAS